MLEKERNELIAEIKRAFANTRYPRQLGDLPDPTEFEGTKWDELSVKVVLSNHYLFLFSEDALKYFLPGYLLVMLKSPHEMFGSFIINGILRHLAQEYDELLPQDLCKLFDKKQRKLILKFLNMFEALWLSPDLDKQVLKVEIKRRSWAKNDLQKGLNESLNLLHLAKEYWQACD